MEVRINWATYLENEDWAFIKRFVLTSGSIKEMAEYYGVTYPTLRIRLDRLIQKIQLAEQPKEDNYVSTIKKLAIEGKIDYEVAKFLINEYRNNKGDV